MSDYPSGKKRLYNIDWSLLFQTLPVWRSLSPAARQLLLQRVEIAVYTRPKMLGDEYPSIENSGLVDVSPSGLGVRFKKDLWSIFRLLKELVGFLDQAASNKSVRVGYLVRYFSWSQIIAFSGDRYIGVDAEVLAGKIASFDWISGFLDVSEGASWENPFIEPNENHFFSSPAVFKSTQALIQSLLDHDGFIPLADLPSLSGRAVAELTDALNAGLRYLLFFITVDPQTFEPALFLWPEIVKRLNRPKPQLPQPIEPVDIVFEMPYRLYDVSALLVECFLEPFRIRSNDSVIFEKVKKYLETKVAPIEEWVLQYSSYQKEGRIHYAINIAYHMSLLAVKNANDSKQQFEVSSKGLEWHNLSPKAQLKKILDTLKPHQFIKMDRNQSYSYYEYTASYQRDDLNKVIWKSFVQTLNLLQKDRFYPLSEFVDYAVSEKNPFLGLNDKKYRLRSFLYFVSRGSSLPELEELWEEILRGFLFDGFLPYGGIKLSRGPSGEGLFALTSIGQYMLETRSDFELKEEKPQVVVQPNFDVVFLSSSPQTEVAFSRFAERVGSGMGTLFHITKKSIQRAAGAGISAETILQELKDISSREIPQNVRHEIAEWHHTHRRAVAQPVILVTCPDDITASKISKRAGNEVKFITDTAIALPLNAVNDKLIQKLREVGVFLDYTPPDLPTRKKKRY